MNREQLYQKIQERKSFLCVGLDPDMDKIPPFLKHLENPIWAFNKAIIDATKPYCVAYKPNFAFYEAYGTLGYEALEKTIQYIGNEHFIIADAKRGDIGNTSKMYAKAAFEVLGADAITVAPYMGMDSVTPFLSYENKWIIVLGLTSNKGSEDFQFIKSEDYKPLYQQVIEKVSSWTSPDNTMFVIGATHPESFKEIRKLIPDHFLLVPGVGEQGGELESVIKFGKNNQIGLLINSSRGILYASKEKDFDKQAAIQSKKIQEIMAQYI